MEGWISLHRQLCDSPLWTCEPFSRGQAWVDLLLLANHSDSFFYKRGVKINVSRGQVGRSEVELSDRWKWSRNKVRKFIKDLEKEQQIEQQKTNVTQLLTIVNYSKFQEKGQQTKQQKDSRRTAEGQQKDTYNNVNNVNNENNVNKESSESNSPQPTSKSKILISEKDKGVLNRTIHLFPEDVVKTVVASTPKKKQWLDTVNKLNRIDGYTHSEIEEVITFGRNDDFWKDNFISILSLRKTGKSGLTKFVTIKTAMNGNRDKQRNGRNSKRKRIEPKFEGL